jgi:hypothetical protein
MQPVQFSPDAIPSELTEIPHWVLWRRMKRQDKWTKVPFNARTGTMADSTNPSTWTSFEDALGAYRSGGAAYDGIGFVVTDDLGICGVDLDKTDQHADDAQQIIDTLDSYTEVTPSGNGYRIFIYATLPGTRKGRRRDWVEAYSSLRFLTLTGNVVRGKAVEQRQAEFDQVYRNFLGDPEAENQPVAVKPKPAIPLDLSDEQLLEKARSASNGAVFSALYDDGDLSAYGGDHSAADLGLCSRLAFWAQGDVERIDRLFQNSALMRDKWLSRRGESTYGQWTMAKGVEGTEFYDPGAVTLMTANKGKAVVRIAQPSSFDDYAMWTADKLMNLELPEPVYAVPGLIAEGLNVLGGKPKMGKSFIALGLGIALSTGGLALGYIDVEPSDVLYLALEDSARRMKDRLIVLTPDGEVPSRLTLVTQPPKGKKRFPRANEGGLDLIEQWLVDNPEASLVMIDTLAMFRPPRSPKGDLYLEDYQMAGDLKILADAHHVAFLAVHHLRKGGSEDWVESLSGSMGLGGAADGILILSRERGSSDAVLKVTGRDVEELEYAMKSQPGGSWVMVGDAVEASQSAISMDITNVMRTLGGRVMPGQVAKELGLGSNTVRQRMWAMGNRNDLVPFVGGGYELPGPRDNAITHNAQITTGGGIYKGPNVTNDRYVVTPLWREGPLILPDGSRLERGAKNGVDDGTKVPSTSSPASETKALDSISLDMDGVDEAAKLLAWIDENQASLPTEPFELWPGVSVSNPRVLYLGLREALTKNAEAPRWSESLRDARRLMHVVEGGEADNSKEVAA